MKNIINNSTPNEDQFKDNPELLKALDIIKNTNKSLLLTGEAGTGKSHFIRYLAEHSGLNVVVVAPTGIAATNINGSTIHSFFQLPTKPILDGDSCIKQFKPDSEKRKIIKEMDLLIIDEISMVDASLMDAINTSLQRNTGGKDLTFGGKQVLMVGDPFQLPPVLIGDKKQLIDELYGNKYFFFDSNVFKNLGYVPIKLVKNYRQSDPNFIELLRNVKYGDPKCLEELNKRVYSRENLHNMDYVLTLATTNKITANVNKTHLDRINGKTTTFIAKVTGNYPYKEFPTDQYLRLKVGAQVIFVRNDADGRWTNGTVTKIHRIEDDKLWVKLEDNYTFEVRKEKWEKFEYKFDSKNKTISSTVTGTFYQFPLKLAWAITIHRAQGLTLNKAIIDLGKGAFCEGQVYVALSRLKKLENLYLTRPIRERDLICNWRIEEKFGDFGNTNSSDNPLPWELD